MDAVELWAGSVRRYHERRRQEARALWYGWHLDQAERHRRTLEDLIAHHEAQAARLCEEPVSGVGPRVGVGREAVTTNPANGTPTNGRHKQ